MNSELNQQILKANIVLRLSEIASQEGADPDLKSRILQEKIARLIVGELSQRKEYINLLTLNDYQLN